MPIVRTSRAAEEIDKNVEIADLGQHKGFIINRMSASSCSSAQGEPREEMMERIPGTIVSVTCRAGKTGR
jgi:hypothetical protein